MKSGENQRKCDENRAKIWRMDLASESGLPVQVLGSEPRVIRQILPDSLMLPVWFSSDLRMICARFSPDGFGFRMDSLLNEICAV